MPAALPNELLILVLCDVIGTYVHSFVLLPSDHRCWHGHYTLRSVSKRFKALVDDIWISAVGGETGQRELTRIHSGISDKSLESPDPSCTPLILGYFDYWMALTKQVEWHALPWLEAAEVLSVSPEAPSDEWIATAKMRVLDIRPPEVGYVLWDELQDALYSCQKGMVDLSMRCLDNLMARLAVYEIGDEHLEALFQPMSDLMQISTEMALEEGVKYVYDGYSFMMLERARISLATLEEGEEDRNSITTWRGKLYATISNLTVLWGEWVEAREYRKHVLHQVARYGVQKYPSITQP